MGVCDCAVGKGAFLKLHIIGIGNRKHQLCRKLFTTAYSVSDINRLLGHACSCLVHDK